MVYFFITNKDLQEETHEYSYCCLTHILVLSRFW